MRALEEYNEKNKIAKSSKFLSPPQAGGVLRNFALTGADFAKAQNPRSKPRGILQRIKLLVMVFVMGLLVISCTVDDAPNDASTDLATEIQIPAVTQTATPQLTSTPRATFTPRPTYTVTLVPDWIVNFTEPILKAIANRPPVYEDDFSDPRSGWYSGPTSGNPDVLILGERRYDQGEYYVRADGATTEHPVVCSGGADRNVGGYTDFVAEFDVRFVSGIAGDWQLFFLKSSNGVFKIQLSRAGHMSFGKCGFDLDGCPDVGASLDDSILGGINWNHIQLIVRDSKMAAYVNGIPSLYAEDEMALQNSMRGSFGVNSCNFDPNPLVTRWDNFKLWDISGLP